MGVPLFDRVNQSRTLVSSNASGILSLVVALASFAVVPVASKPLRPLLYSITALSSVSALTCFRTRDQQQLILADHEKLADQARQNATAEVFSEEARIAFQQSLYNREPSGVVYSAGIPSQTDPSPVDSSSEAYFDWAELINNETEYPHAAILNKTGGGKSTLAQWLAKSLGGTIYAVDPHWEPGSYPDAHMVIGKGRNVGESADSFEEITNRKGEVVGTKGEVEIARPHELCTVTQFMNWLHREMNSRYQRRMLGDTQFEPITVIFDEFSSYSKKEGFSVRFKELIREARKVKIRLIVLLQGSQVGELGLEGSSDLRANLTFIRLGKFALEYAESRLRNAKPNTLAYAEAEQVLRLLKQAKRPALIEDKPANVPDL